MIRVSNQEHRSLVERELTYILNLKLLPIMITQIQLQSPIEQFQKHLKTHFSANHFNYMIPTAFSRRSHLHAAFCVDRLHLREEVTRRGEDTQGHRTTWVS